MEYNIMAGFLGAFYVAGIDPNDSASMSPANTLYKDSPVMQFTGLLDKNGKEIYEGDIIQVFTRELKEPAYVVTIRDMMEDKFLGVGHGEGEIIGNIYSNPDLIK